MDAMHVTDVPKTSIEQLSAPLSLFDIPAAGSIAGDVRSSRSVDGPDFSDVAHDIELHESPPAGGPGGSSPGVLLDVGDEHSSSCAVVHGKCGRFVPNSKCQCDSGCERRRDCCRNYLVYCNGYRPKDPLLASPSNAPTLSFYMYRSQNDRHYPPLNTNMASLGGVLWYLQNEVVNGCFSGRGHAGDFGVRRFQITRILRYKVTLKAPEPLFKMGMNFGPRVAFDFGKNNGAWVPRKDKAKAYDVFGYVVGCNVVGKGPYPTCPSRQGEIENFCPIKYPNATWYSLPGRKRSWTLGKKFDSMRLACCQVIGRSVPLA
eukprot:TRINITY_DN34910_c0_g1_i2.p1 TRINITY_DN34910_c0_g1~~TRINITY_DN34910_c0_g1_i2.p1  ORF type:complete len:356 (-),score=36.65 TRINITY_DN34910_c0_g1_i2:9-959(-)